MERGRNESTGNDAQLYWLLGVSKLEQQQYALAVQALRLARAANQNHGFVLRDLAESLLAASPRVIPENILTEVYECVVTLEKLDAKAGKQLSEMVDLELRRRR